MKKIITFVMLVGFFGFGFSQSGYYNDYRSSINTINWQTVVADLLLTPQQKDQLFALNNRYPSYDNWVVVYRDKPDRWRNDRYYEIERILGPAKYRKFKNKYYKGQNPVAVYHRNDYHKNSYREYDKHDKKQWKEHSKGKKNHHH